MTLPKNATNEDREKLNAYRRKRYAENPHRAREYMRSWYVRNGHFLKNRNLKRDHNITLQERNDMLALQGNCCEICKSNNSGGKHDWHVDHCHKSGVIRGILCHHCNVLLANAKDDQNILSAAIKYIEKHSDV